MQTFDWVLYELGIGHWIDNNNRRLSMFLPLELVCSFHYKKQSNALTVEIIELFFIEIENWQLT